MGFAYCDFRHQGGAHMLMARATEVSRAEFSARVETPPVESARLEPVKSETKSEPAKSDSVPELRRPAD
ncbi:MAG: hypothetical protein WCE35_22910 [Bradyrhizobium sp.]